MIFSFQDFSPGMEVPNCHLGFLSSSVDALTSKRIFVRLSFFLIGFLKITIFEESRTAAQRSPLKLKQQRPFRLREIWKNQLAISNIVHIAHSEMNVPHFFILPELFEMLHQIDPSL